jgi:uncharacterized protein YbjT (DUF2867 family)
MGPSIYKSLSKTGCYDVTRTITLFGGTGFLGRHIIRRLAKSGAEIRVPTRDLDKALPLKTAGGVGQIVPIACDLRDDAKVLACIAGSDIVINLVGILFEKGRNNFEAVHVEWAARVARLARQAGVQQFIHVSALGASPGARARYAMTKAAGEAAVKTFVPDATILRPSLVVGPEDEFFNLFATLSLWPIPLPLIGGGHTKFQPVYVGDIAAAVEKVMGDNRYAGQIYELGGPRAYSFHALLELMAHFTGRPLRTVKIPFAVARIQAALLNLMPRPLLTPDQVILLESDNILSGRQKGFADMGIKPTAIEAILPTYLDRFRKGGRFGKAGKA